MLIQSVVYLSPADYHRFHSPADWTVERRRHFPGKLLSVTPGLVRRLPGLFHTNERVAFLGRWRHGFFCLVAVGATNVGSIHAAFDEDLATNTEEGAEMSEKVYEGGGVVMRKGDEFGHFDFGSTVVLIFEAPVDAGFRVDSMTRIRVGEGIL